MKNYYFILGLNIYAQHAEIKQSFRRLALQFHPDKNASREAEAIFKEVNEAYEVLGDPESKAAYDRQLRGNSPQPINTSHRDPRYRPKPPGSYARSNKRQEALEQMAAYLQHAVMISRVSFVFAIVLIADFSLPSKRIEREILQVKREWRSGSSTRLRIENGRGVTLPEQVAEQFSKGSKVYIYQSAFFSVPLIMENEVTQYKADIPVSIYGNFVFFPLILLITALLGTFYWKGVEFRFNLGVVNLLLLFLNFLFLHVHKL